MTNPTDRGLTHIREKFHDREELFGIRFEQGTVFLQVDAVEHVKFDPYEEVEVDGVEGAEIDPGSFASFQNLTHDGDDILHIDSQSENAIIHAAIGQYPSELRRYTNYPEAGERLGQMENLSSPRPASGSDYGYIDGRDSPLSFPSSVSEMVIPPNVNLDFAFHNPTNKAIKPILNISTAQYKVTPLDPSSDKDAIRRIVQPGSPMPIYDAGSRDKQIRYELKWGVDPLSETEVNRL